ncbi:MAG TPA: PAS domain S-box protein [Burkholderiales bacterium]|nr:PAS domain S-box protein [Burkholderiales bacterium]
MINLATPAEGEVRRLQGCINDLVSIQAMPAILSGQDSAHMVGTLLDVLVRLLPLDFAYARLNDSITGSQVEFARLAHCRNRPLQAQEIGRALDRWLTDNSVSAPFAVPNPVGDGEVRIAPFRLGLQEEIGSIVVGSARLDFPTQTDTLLLRVAANQAVVALQEARRLIEQKRAVEELERRVAERTAQLTAANTALNEEAAQRHLAESEAVEARDELASELNSMTRLHVLSTHLLAHTELQPLLEEVLDATIALHDADLGLVQLYNSETGQLAVVAQRGFDPNFVVGLKNVDQHGGTSCGRAMRTRERVIIEDVLTEADYAPYREAAAASGYRALQSTPLFSRTGELLGVISTHFHRPHRPLEHELRLTDLYARPAAEMIERKQAEKALRESEEKYRTLFDSMDQGFCTIEVLFDQHDKPIDYRFLEVNPSFQEQTGIKDVPGRRMREIAPEHEDHWFEIYGKIALTGEPARFEKPAAKLDRWYDVYAFRVGEPKERQVAVLFNDITERKRTEEALRASEERFRRYFDLGLIGMAITSPAKGCLEVNDELCRILGYTREELLHKTWAEMTYPDDLSADVDQFNRVLTGEIDGYSLDKRWIRKDGAVIHSIMAARCLRRADGTVDYFVGLVQDVTERKHAEQALAQVRFELARMMRVTTMGELAASIAHEINQPLAAVVVNGHACARWLAANPPDLGEANDAVKRIVRDANRAAEIIKRIRAFLQRGAEERAAIDLDALISEVIAMVQGEVRGKSVSLRIASAAGLPSVSADRVQLQQVILNLVMNAIDAMGTVTDRPRVLEIGAARHGADLLRIAVRDSGVGLEPAQRERVFDAFHTTKPDGMGMGLAISRSIVEAHGGRLWATHNEDAGETFQLTLPLAVRSAVSSQSV